jgi:hypothetical protein
MKKDAFDRLLGPAMDLLKRNAESYKALEKQLQI